MRRVFVFAVATFLSMFFVAKGENVAHGVRVVVIDAGHGGSAYPGAVRNGVCEKDINLKVALKLGALIEKELPDIKVVYTRTTDKYFSKVLTDDLQARADIANSAGGDLFISIHANAARNTSIYGTETLIMGESPTELKINDNAVYENNRDELIDMSDSRTAAIVRAYIENLQFTYGEYSMMMAKLVQKHYVAAGRRHRDIRPQLLKVLYATDMPSVLTEIGFMSNDAEFKYINSEKGQNEIARALLGAVKDYTEYVCKVLLMDEKPTSQSVEKSSPVEQKTEPVKSKPTPETKQKNAPKEKSVQPKSGRSFAIQIIASATRISVDDAQFRSYRRKVAEVRGEGRFSYKYCVGNYASRAEASKALAAVKKEFPSAFIVEVQGDKIVK